MEGTRTGRREKGGDMGQLNEVKLRAMEKNDRRRLVMPEDVKLREKCEALRYAVEHPNERGDIVFNGQGYRLKDPTAWIAFDYNGVRVGYRVVPCSPLEINHYFDRMAFFEVPGYRIYDLTVTQLVSIKTAVLDAFFEPQMSRVHENIGKNNERVMMTQRFMVAVWTPKSPGIVKTLTGVDVNAAGALQ
jgi:hypothetical protein